MPYFHSPQHYSSKNYHRIPRDYHINPQQSRKSQSSQFDLNKIDFFNIGNLLGCNFDNQQDKKIGHYKYNSKNRIGKGFSSIVYKAQSQNSKQHFAIKVINLKNLSQFNLQMLENQIKILQNLSHPNIVKCYDIYKSKSKCYIVTELCTGGDLLEYLKKRVTVSQKNALEIIQDVNKGLKHLQKIGVIHRDLKPANILRGKGGWKIADFGFAVNSSEQFKSKHNVGTPLYMALESLTSNIYSPSSDIFSLGIILFEMLTGSTPWESKTEKQLIKKMSTKNNWELKFRQTHRISKRTLQILRLMCKIDRQERMTKSMLSSLSFQIQQNDSDTFKNSQMIRPSMNVDSPRFKKLNSQNSPKDSERSPLYRYKSTQNLVKLNKSYKINEQKSPQCRVFSPSCLNINIDEPIYSPPKRQAKLYKKSSLQGSLKGSMSNIVISKSQRLLCSSHDYKAQSLFLHVNPSARISCTSAQQQQRRSVISNKASQSTDERPNSKISQFEQQQYGHILTNQIHYCRFLHSLYKNKEYILLDEKKRQKMGLILLKYSQKMLSQIQNLQLKNYFDFQSYSQYLNCSKYKQIKETSKQYHSRYQKQFMMLLGNSDQQVVYQVFSEMKIFQSKQSSSRSLLKYILVQINGLLKDCDKNMNAMLNSFVDRNMKNNQSKSQSKFIKANIFGHKQLMELQRLIQLCINCGKNYMQFQKTSKIKVNSDFLKSC